jgi:putative ABC transport system ATP-binding protein
MDRTAEPVISLRGVSKDYESGAGVVHAMREVTLVVQPGEFLAMVGTSGSGKSTLMNVVGCLDRPTRGTYHLSGIDVGGRTNDARAVVRNRLIGFIFQGFNLLARTTALENVELPLQYRGVARSERRRRALEALTAVGLGDRVHHTPNQLSGGQQQRVAIARALVTNPPLLLADEPTGNLDTRTSLEVLALLQHLNRTVGITIVLVTHEHDIAMCASRVVTMSDGRVVSDQTNASPHNASSELARLPVVEDSPSSAPQDSLADPRERRRRLLGGPIPFSVFAAAFAGTLGGVALGVLYDGVILQRRIVWIPLLCALLGETFVAARYGARRLGGPLTRDQRGRFAVTYTVVFLTLAASVALVGVGWLPAAELHRLQHASVPGVLALLVALTLAVSLARFLLVTFFSPKAAE